MVRRRSTSGGRDKDEPDGHSSPGIVVALDLVLCVDRSCSVAILSGPDLHTVGCCGKETWEVPEGSVHRGEKYGIGAHRRNKISWQEVRRIGRPQIRSELLRTILSCRKGRCRSHVGVRRRRRVRQGDASVPIRLVIFGFVPFGNLSLDPYHAISTHISPVLRSDHPVLFPRGGRRAELSIHYVHARDRSIDVSRHREASPRLGPSGRAFL